MSSDENMVTTNSKLCRVSCINGCGVHGFTRNTGVIQKCGVVVLMDRGIATNVIHVEKHLIT